MIIYAIDDEALALTVLSKAIRAAAPDAELFTFSDPQTLLDTARKSPCDVAFLDINMRGMSGLELAQDMLLSHPTTNVIFVTGYREYMEEAWNIMASGYITKPVTEEKVLWQLMNLRHSSSVPKKNNRVSIRCFGDFEIRADGTPLHFRYDRSREVLAYLTHRQGAEVSSQELCDLLWDDGQRHLSYFQQLRRDILTALNAVHCSDIVATGWGKLQLNTSAVDCDYYDYLAGRGKITAPYLVNYAWAAETRDKLK